MFRIFILVSMLFFSLTAFSDSKPKLTVYTYSSFISEWGPGNELKKLFESEYGYQIKFLAFGDGVTILNRLKLEGKNSKADVILGLDNNLILAAKQADLVRSHHIKPFENRQLDWWDDNFIPYDYGYFTFIYNKNNINKPPKSMRDLLSDRNQWKIVYQDPRTSTPGLGLMLWIQSIYGNNSAQAWQQLEKKTLTVTKGWSEAYSLMLNNEADFVLSYDTSPAAHIMNENSFNYVATSFEEGHYEQIEVAGITKNSQNFKLAKQFLYFLGTPKAQYLLATHNVMHPVINIQLPKAFSELIKVKKTLMLPAAQIEANRKQWIKIWQNAVSQ